MRWPHYSTHPWVSPFQGCCEQRSNLLHADLSLTRITYFSKLIGIYSFAAFLQPELFRGYFAEIRLTGVENAPINTG